MQDFLLQLLYISASVIGLVNGALSLLTKSFKLRELRQEKPFVPGEIPVLSRKTKRGWEIVYEIPKEETTRRLSIENNRLTRENRRLHGLLKNEFRLREVLLMIGWVFFILLLVVYFLKKN